jgi:predicted DNA-binding helix-hairpin-helix protein
MDIETKFQLVSSEMQFEPAEEVALTSHAPFAQSPISNFQSPTSNLQSPTAPGPCGHSPAEWSELTREEKRATPIHMAAMPGGKRLPMLKTMLTTACERDCFYCPFRAGRTAMRRATLKPEEMAKTFHELNRKGVAQGLFLSSGIIKGGMRTQDKLIDTVDILRRKHNYTGYVHLKIMPGSERDQIFRAMQLADRVSINLEAANEKRLPALAPHKNFFAELLQALQWADAIRNTQPASLGWKGRWPSLVTQFVVGAAGESDLEILSTTEYLIKKLRLARAYYSAFSPVRDTPLENTAPENPWREHRLYQSSFLLRDYGFDLEDLPFAPDGNLPLDVDPKLGWARGHLADSPVELNRADRRTLLRVPGIGPKAAEAILAARRRGTLRELRDLKALGILASRAAPFVLLDGRRPTQQLPLFA